MEIASVEEEALSNSFHIEDSLPLETGHVCGCFVYHRPLLHSPLVMYGVSTMEILPDSSCRDFERLSLISEGRTLPKIKSQGTTLKLVFKILALCRKMNLWMHIIMWTEHRIISCAESRGEDVLFETLSVPEKLNKQQDVPMDEACEGK